MANPTNKLTVVKNGVVQTCQTYLAQADATPAYDGGSYLPIVNNGVACFLGLNKTTDANTKYNTPLTVKKGDAEYYIQTQVVACYNIVVPATTNQSVKLTYVSFPSEETKTVTTKDGGTYPAVGGTPYTVELVPDSGYSGGTITPASGTVGAPIEFSVTDPTATKTYTFTITQSDNETITVTCNGTDHTATFEAPEGATWTATVTPATGYAAGTLSATSGTVTAATSVSVTAATDTRVGMITLTDPTGLTLKVTKPDGSAVSNGDTITNGTVLTVTYSAGTGYENAAVTVNGSAISNGGTFTFNSSANVVGTVSKVSGGIGFTFLHNGGKFGATDSKQLSYLSGCTTGYNGTVVYSGDGLVSNIVTRTEEAVTFDFTVPAGYSKVAVIFNCEDNSDEHSYCSDTKVYCNDGQSWYQGRTNSFDVDLNGTTYTRKGSVVSVTGGKTYSMYVYQPNNGYNRAYGVSFLLGTSVDALTQHLADYNGTLAYFDVTFQACTGASYTVGWDTYFGTAPAAITNVTAATTVSAPFGATYNISYNCEDGYSASAVSGFVTGATTIKHDVDETSDDCCGD